MLDIFVCDNDKNTTEFLKNCMTQHFGEQHRVVTMHRCQELLGLIEMNGRVPDILIMDINHCDGNGIETVKHLQKNYPHLKVIYLADAINYTTEIFETNPSYFLLKPINEDELGHALEKVSKETKSEKSDFFIVKIRGSEILLHRKDVMYAESRGRKLVLHMADGQQYEIYGKMDLLQTQLGETFLRSHKSFLINMKYISERTGNEFCLSDGRILPISRTNLKDARVKFMSYLGKA